MNQIHDPAKQSLQELVKYVFSQTTETLKGITYQDLAFHIGRLNKHGDGHAHGMGKVLGDMGHLLQQLEGEWGEPIPHIQSLVVNKAGTLKGLPDEGIREFWPDYPLLKKPEKQNKVRTEYVQILEFGSRWNKVLKDLGLEPIKEHSSSTISYFGHGRGGESKEHKALKNFVASNPEMVGASKSDQVFPEYPFPSLDTVDVMFKSPDHWIAVEVKSRISDKAPKDYERGIYQCVKYQALLIAMQQDHRYAAPEKITVVLLTESRLPSEYRDTLNSLDVKLIENVIVPEISND